VVRTLLRSNSIDEEGGAQLADTASVLLEDVLLLLFCEPDFSANDWLLQINSGKSKNNLIFRMILTFWFAQNYHQLTPLSTLQKQIAIQLQSA